MQNRVFFFTIIFFLFIILTSFINQNYKDNNKNIATSGSVNFLITTSTTGTAFAPDHILAIWVENSSGEFIKSLKVKADYQIYYLYQWKNSSASNTTDAITGATLSIHQAHNLTWDCTDISGNVVPNGNYKIRVEFSEKNGQGPYTEYAFTKGATNVDLTPADETYFKNVSLNYTPETTSIDEFEQTNFITIYPNPAKDFIVFTSENTIDEISIYSQNGKIIETNIVNNKNEYTCTFNKDLPIGIYFYKFLYENNLQTGKFLIIK